MSAVSMADQCTYLGNCTCSQCAADRKVLPTAQIARVDPPKVRHELRKLPSGEPSRIERKSGGDLSREASLKRSGSGISTSTTDQPLGTKPTRSTTSHGAKASSISPPTSPVASTISDSTAPPSTVTSPSDASTAAAAFVSPPSAKPKEEPSKSIFTGAAAVVDDISAPPAPKFAAAPAPAPASSVASTAASSSSSPSAPFSAAASSAASPQPSSSSAAAKAATSVSSSVYTPQDKPAPPKIVEHSGWLTKHGGGQSCFGRKSWKRRWFELRGQRLTYHEAKGAPVIDEITVTGSMSLELLVEKGQARRGKRLLVLSTPARTYHCLADTQEEGTAWLDALKLARAGGTMPGKGPATIKRELVELTLLRNPGEALGVTIATGVDTSDAGGEGLFVRVVKDGSVGAMAGLRKGDLLASVNHQALGGVTVEDATRMLSDQFGEVVVGVMRKPSGRAGGSSLSPPDVVMRPKSSPRVKARAVRSSASEAFDGAQPTPDHQAADTPQPFILPGAAEPTPSPAAPARASEEAPAKAAEPVKPPASPERPSPAEASPTVLSPPSASSPGVRTPRKGSKLSQASIPEDEPLPTVADLRDTPASPMTPASPTTADTPATPSTPSTQEESREERLRKMRERRTSRKESHQMELMDVLAIIDSLSEE